MYGGSTSPQRLDRERERVGDDAAGLGEYSAAGVSSMRKTTPWPRLPKPLHAVHIKRWVDTDDRRAIGDGLCDDQTIEWIFVMLRQGNQGFKVV